MADQGVINIQAVWHIAPSDASSTKSVRIELLTHRPAMGGADTSITRSAVTPTIFACSYRPLGSAAQESFALDRKVH